MKFDTRAQCYMLITVLMCEIWFKGTMLYAVYSLDVWFFEVFAIHKCLGKISSQNLLFSKFTEFSIEIWCNSANMEKMRWNEICPKLYKWQNLWKNKHQNRSKHITIYLLPKFSPFEELQILEPNLPKKYEWKEFWKNKH